MKPIEIRDLSAGAKFSEPLYDCSKNLLLAQSMSLTPEMIQALNRSPDDFVYLGEWNELDFRWHQAKTSLSDRRAEAETVTDRLREDMSVALERTELKVQPTGTAFQSQIRGDVVRERSAGVLQEYRSSRERAMSVVADVIHADVHPDYIEKVAGEMVDDLFLVMQEDPNLCKALAQLGDQSEYAYSHALNVTVQSLGIAAELQYEASQLKQVGVSALLQDLGMAMVPTEVLDKRRKLSPSEFVDIQKHPFYSVFSIKEMRGLPYVTGLIAFQMHERIDGSGYPNMRPGILIHRYAQMAAIADVYDALIRDRPWRRAYHPCKAMEILIHESGKGKYDPDILRAFLRFQSLYPVGCMVRLESGDIAQVVHANGQAIDRPVVAIVADSTGNALDEFVLIDLLKDETHRVAGTYEEKSEAEPLAGFSNETESRPHVDA